MIPQLFRTQNILLYNELAFPPYTGPRERSTQPQLRPKAHTKRLCHRCRPPYIFLRRWRTDTGPLRIHYSSTIARLI